MSDPEIDANTLVSHTDTSGRTLSGMGADVEQLADTMERHAPPEPSATPASETPTPAQTDSQQQPSPSAPVSRGRQRFSDLTKERDEAKAAAEAAKAEREQFARELEALRRERQEATAKTPEPPAELAPTPGEDFPEFDEWLALKGNDAKTFKHYQIELTKWTYQQQAPQYQQTVREILSQERQRYQVDASMRAAQDRGRKTYADFDTLLKGPAGQVQLGRTEAEANERLDFIAAHPASEHIQYAILKDKAFAEKLGASDGVTFGMLIAGLVPQPKQTPAWTPPPAPAPTVGASSPTVSASSADLAKKGGYDFDSSGYREKRAAERGLKSSRRW